MILFSQEKIMQQAQEYMQEQMNLEDLSDNDSYEEHGLTYHPNRVITWQKTIDPKKNPIMMKVMMIIMHVCFLPVVITALITAGGFDATLFMILFGSYLLVMAIGYFCTKLVEHLDGGSYDMRFVMTEDGVGYNPQKTLVDQVIENGSDPSGVFHSGNCAGYSEFKNVRRVEGIRSENMIRVNSPFLFNMIFVPDEAFNDVFYYIAARCPKAKIELR